MLLKHQGFVTYKMLYFISVTNTENKLSLTNFFLFQKVLLTYILLSISFKN